MLIAQRSRHILDFIRIFKTEEEKNEWINVASILMKIAC